jgi:hypothetical protein
MMIRFVNLRGKETPGAPTALLGTPGKEGSVIGFSMASILLLWWFYSPIILPTITFMTSVVPAKMGMTRTSRAKRQMGYSSM